jgi:hypothetical protein
MLEVCGDGLWTLSFRETSHYGRRWRGRQSPPIKLQESKSSASWPFTLWPKSKGHRNFKCSLVKKATDSQRKFGLDGNGNPNYGWEAVGFISLENQSLTRSWPLDWRGYFEQGIKWDAPLGLAFGGFTLCPAEGCTYYILLAIIFSPFLWTLNKSLATQSHSLSTWTTIVWSDPKVKHRIWDEL